MAEIFKSVDFKKIGLKNAVLFMALAVTLGFLGLIFKVLAKNDSDANFFANQERTKIFSIAEAQAQCWSYTGGGSTSGGSDSNTDSSSGSCGATDSSEAAVTSEV